MNDISIALIILSSIIFIISFASQVRVVKNEEIRSLMKKASEAYINSFIDFDIPMFIIGIIASIFYTIVSIVRMAIKGKLIFFIIGLLKEKDFMIRTTIAFIYFVIGIILSLYSLYLEYIVLIFFVFATILLFFTIDRYRGT